MVSQTTAAACYNSLLLAREYFAPASAWFYRVQLVYILCIAFVGGSIVYGVQGSAAPYNYIDCAFIMTSAVTGCGLQTFDMTPMHSGSKVAIFMAALVGGSVFVSVTPSTYRRLVIWRAARVALRCSTGKEPRLAAYLSTHLEYRALGWVRLLVLLYWASVQLVVWLSLGIYLSVYTGAATLSERSGMSPVWFSAFIANMGFANVGLVPLPNSLYQFSADYAVLLLLALATVLGGTLYPTALYCLVLALRASPLGRNDTSLEYIIDRPRRVHTHLFPPAQTIAVLSSNVFLAVFQWVVYSATCASLPVYADYPGHVRSLVSFFQAISTRNAGFAVFDLSTVSTAAQLSSFVAMYVPVYPFAASLSGTTLYPASGVLSSDVETSVLDQTKPPSLPPAPEGGGSVNSFNSLEMPPYRTSIRSSDTVPVEVPPPTGGFSTSSGADWLSHLSARPRPAPPHIQPEDQSQSTVALSVTSFAGFNI